MGFQWAMAREDVDAEEEINSWLKLDFEPFGVCDGEVFFKKHIYVEDGDKATEREGD